MSFLCPGLTRRTFSWLSTLLLISSLCAQTPADSPAVTIRSNVRLVQIDVIAKDKHGNPVSGLEAKDFTLLDDGVPQKIARISVERGAGESDMGNTIADAAKQTGTPIFSNIRPDNVVPTVILFDVLNTPPEDQRSMEKALVQSLKHMKEGTPIALLILGDDLAVVSDFTTSSISLSRIAEAEFHPRAEGFGPPLSVRKTSNALANGMMRKGLIKEFRAQEHERIARTLSALHVISERLGPMRGRKSLLWMTAGLSTPDGYPPVEEAIDRLNDANVAVYTVDARGVLLDPDNATEPSDLIADIKADHEESRGDILSVVATATGGVPYRNTNRLEDAISQAMADRGLVYVLDYYPRHGDWTGKLHKLRVKTSHSGVRLRFRSSYRATLPVRPNAQEQREVLATLASSPLEYSGIHFNVQVEPGPAADPRFMLHVPADQVQWSAGEGKMQGKVQVWFIQKRASGEDLVTNTSKTDLRLAQDSYQEEPDQAVSLTSDLKLDPSSAKVRVMLLDVNSGKVGTVDVPVDSKAPQPKSR
ncbi:MAG TPA: VWA domain-containing protein [Candidatus Sulfotelmatobacter sp.]|nr:VWA domain-containing protein [Candidatus Sulfotelmatobacter sp.]